MQTFSALVIGATGLIGEQLVQLLLSDPVFSKVTILVRRKVDLSHPKLQVELVNFDNLGDYRKKMVQSDCIFCCVGTTQKKAGGDQSLYRMIDFDIPVNAAIIGRELGCKKYLLVSSVGADPFSKNFYLAIKGEVEKEIASLRYESFHVFRPSILFGDRKEFRLGEIIGKAVVKALSFIFVGGLKKYKGIESSDVARSMVVYAKTDSKGMFTHHYSDMAGKASAQ